MDDDGEVEASPAANKFAAISANDYSASLKFLGQHPEILTERETDGLLVLAFDAALERKDDLARQCVHQALLLQYCRALGKDGVALFFKRITTPGHRAQEVFRRDVQDTYTKILNRGRSMAAERDNEAEHGVEQIQLHPVEPAPVAWFLAGTPAVEHLHLHDCYAALELPPAALRALQGFRGPAIAAAGVLPGRPVRALALVGHEFITERDLGRIARTSVPIRWLDLSGMSVTPILLRDLSRHLHDVEVLKVRLALRHTLHHALSGIVSPSLPFCARPH